ncbi:MAG: methionyl-tRNA formyltransferase [Bdellovibrionaceae bacterium]|nr:methionyl-tRNA formyltransferase [Pseudobdellovibrionaceae bacterium]
MSKVRVLFLGTPEFAVASLQRMIADEHFELVGVVTQPDRPAGRKMQLQPSPVKQLALQHGLRVFTPESVNKPEILDELRTLGAESAAVVAFGQILSQKFLDLFPHGAVNVHGSLLPRWRGAAPIQRSLMAGDNETGVCLQTVVKKLDAGALLGSRKVSITDQTDAVSLHDELKALGADLLQTEFMDYLRGHLTAIAQDESQVTYAAKIDKAEAKIEWGRPSREIFNQIRGLTMGPIAWSSLGGKMVKFHRTYARSDGDSRVVPGTVLDVQPSSFSIACSQGRLEVLEIQPESRSKMTADAYVRGYPLQPGDRFGS